MGRTFAEMEDMYKEIVKRFQKCRSGKRESRDV